MSTKCLRLLPRRIHAIRTFYQTSELSFQPQRLSSRSYQQLTDSFYRVPHKPQSFQYLTRSLHTSSSLLHQSPGSEGPPVTVHYIKRDGTKQSIVSIYCSLRCLHFPGLIGFLPKFRMTSDFILFKYIISITCYPTPLYSEVHSFILRWVERVIT